MPSPVSICNAALIKLGADPIEALGDEAPRAVVLNERYPAIRDAELRKRRWHCAIKRAQLAADAAAPIGDDFAYQYTLPANCLRPIQIGLYHVGLDLSDYRARSSAEYTIEGRRILTNLAAPLFLRYVARVEEGLFDPALAEALAARVAYECCERITQSDSKKAAALTDYRVAVREAMIANAIERAPESVPDDTWVAARQR